MATLAYRAAQPENYLYEIKQKGTKGTTTNYIMVQNSYVRILSKILKFIGFFPIFPIM